VSSKFLFLALFVVLTLLVAEFVTVTAELITLVVTPYRKI
jgi:hypothetical protein